MAKRSVHTYTHRIILLVTIMMVLLMGQALSQEITFSITGVIPVERMKPPGRLYSLESIELFLVAKPQLVIFVPQQRIAWEERGLWVMISHIEPQTKRFVRSDLTSVETRFVREPQQTLFTVSNLEILPSFRRISIPVDPEYPLFRARVAPSRVIRELPLYEAMKRSQPLPAPVEIAPFRASAQMRFFDLPSQDPKYKTALKIPMAAHLGFLSPDEIYFAFRSSVFFLEKDFAPIDGITYQMGFRLGDTRFESLLTENRKQFIMSSKGFQYFTGIAEDLFHMGGWIFDWPLKGVDLGMVVLDGKILPLAQWTVFWPQPARIGLTMEMPDLYGPRFQMDFGHYYGGLFGGFRLHNLDWAWYGQAGLAFTEPFGISGDLKAGIDNGFFLGINLKLQYPLSSVMSVFMANQVTYRVTETTPTGQFKVGFQIQNIDFSILLDYHDQGVKYGAIIGARF